MTIPNTTSLAWFLEPASFSGKVMKGHLTAETKPSIWSHLKIGGWLVQMNFLFRVCLFSRGRIVTTNTLPPPRKPENGKKHPPKNGKNHQKEFGPLLSRVVLPRLMYLESRILRQSTRPKAKACSPNKQSQS